ncbi:MAG: DoxX family protein [Rhizobiales bacterium]|nr:DoxX family protein [Hyphomicrobiales bacterium]
MNAKTSASRAGTVGSRRILEVVEPIALLALRIALAIPFYLSGLTKWDGFFRLSDNAIFLFENEFKLHLFGRMVDFPFPTLSAYGAAVAEIVVPILLVVGFAARPAALVILGMTAVIQLVAPDAWVNFHLPWAAMALAILAFGAGKLSADHLLTQMRGRS